MQINWNIVVQIATPFLTLFLGAFLNRLIERKPKIVSYIGHASAFQLNDQNRTRIHTHSVVVSNSGSKTAKNVRLGHFVLPEHFQITPNVEHTVNRFQDGTAEIHIPQIVPEETLTVSYLYFPPVLWNQINSYTKHDDGLAKVIPVLLTKQYPKWLNRLLMTLVYFGGVAVLYLFFELAKYIWCSFN